MKNSNGEFRSRVYTDRPAYADFDAPMKFEAIKSIIAKRLTEHPNAICSYSGGSDSDILLHLIESVRQTFNLPPIKYCFFNTGLEMKAIKDHVLDTEKKYGVEITQYRPKIGIVTAARRYGESTSFARYSHRSEIDMPYTIKKNNDGTYTAYIAKREKVFPDILKAEAWCSEIRGEA